MKFTGERFVLGKASGGIETEHLHRYNSLLKMSSGKKILDAACGEGFGSAILAKNAQYVCGVDISSEAISYAKANYQQYNLEFKQGSIEKLEFEDDYFDMVVSFETIEHVDAGIQEKFLNEICRVLKKDGILIMSTPDKFLHTDLPKHNNPYHIKEFYYNEFAQFLASKFKFVEFYNQTIDNFGLILNYDETKRNNIRIIDQEKYDSFGKYIIALCSNVEIEDKNILNTMFAHKDDTGIKIQSDSDFLQIFWDNNNGFIEYNSVKAMYKLTNEFQTLSLHIPNQAVGKLRIDIGNRPSIIQMKKDLIIKRRDKVFLQEIKITSLEGLVRLNDEDDCLNFISLSNDPQLIVDYFFEEPTEELNILVDIKVLEFNFDVCLEKLNDFLKIIN
ncbi:putative S-adenosylmethionine-dependent methyltransferase [compost metagenome]